MSANVLETQRRYYAARAPEYDDWWCKRGRYVLDAENEKLWWQRVVPHELAARVLPLGFELDLRVARGGNILYGSGR